MKDKYIWLGGGLIITGLAVLLAISGINCINFEKYSYQIHTNISSSATSQNIAIETQEKIIAIPSILVNTPVYHKSTPSYQQLTDTLIIPSTISTVYENQFYKITVPTGWIAKQVPYHLSSIYITKGKYILYIDTRFLQASGIIGGRFIEWAQAGGNAPSVDAIMISPPNGPCGEFTTSNILINNMPTQRTDYFISPVEEDDICAKPTINRTVWYLSYVGDGINYRKQNDLLDHYSWVVTMSYNETIVNSFPVKNSFALNQALSEMTDIISTLIVKDPILYIPEVSEIIQKNVQMNWLPRVEEGTNSTDIGCAENPNIPPDSVQSSFILDSTDKIFSPNEIQANAESVKEILRNDGWEQCNTLSKHSPPGYYVETTDDIDVFRMGNEFAQVDTVSILESDGIKYYYIVIDFIKLW